MVADCGCADVSMKITTAEFLHSAYHLEELPIPQYPEVAFAGRSNVGKSSLINTLVNRKRLARTSSIPGKTQSINLYLVNNSICLVDLPGYGYARVPQRVRKGWGPLIEGYCQRRENLKGVVVIMDARIGPTPLDRSLILWLQSLKLPCIFVMTKVDKVSRNKAKASVQKTAAALMIPASKILPFSSQTGEGKKELWQRISHLIATR